MCAWPLPFALLRGRSRWLALWDSMKTLWWLAMANKKHWEERVSLKREVREACQTHSDATRQCIEAHRRFQEALERPNDLKRTSGAR